MIAGFVAGLLAHQSDRLVRGLDTDVQLIARYTIGLLTVMGVAAGGLRGADRARLVRSMLSAAVGVGAGVVTARMIDRLR